MSRFQIRLLLLVAFGAVCLFVDAARAQDGVIVHDERVIAARPFADRTLDREPLDEVKALLALRRISRGNISSAMGRAPDVNPALAFASQSGAIAGRLSGLAHTHGAYVMAWMEDSTRSDYVSAYAKVEPDGTYIVEGLASGAYYVIAWADGYEPMYYDNVTDFREAETVAVGESAVEGVDFDMIKIVPGTGSISGTVRSDVDGSSVERADVYAFDPDYPNRYGYAVTGEAGSYIIEGLKSGSYVVQVYASRYLPEFYDDAQMYEAAARVEVVEPDVTAGVDFSLALGGSVSGRILDDSGTPVIGAYLIASTPFLYDSTGIGPDGQTGSGSYGNYSGWAISDANGYYRIDGLPTGEYIVLAQIWTQWSYIFQWYDHVDTPEQATILDISAGEDVSGIDFNMPIPSARSAIAGTIADSDGDPVADAFVLVEQVVADPPGTGSYVWAYGLSDPAGEYVIEGLPAGRYRVSASAQVGWTYVQRWYPNAATLEEAQPLDIEEDERITGIDFVLPADAGSSAISGLIVDQNDSPLPNAFVEVTSPGLDGGGFWAYGTTNSLGRYRVDYLPEGEYVVHASYWADDRFGQEWYDGANKPEDATPVLLAQNDERDAIDFRLTIRPMYGIVEGTVSDEFGHPIERAYIELQPVARNMMLDAPLWYPSTYAVTDADGFFKIDRVAEGAYLIAAYANGGFEYFDDAETAEAAMDVHVIGGNVTTVEIDITTLSNGEGAIAGLVEPDDYGYALPEGSGSPIPVAVVLAEPTSGASDHRYTAVTEPDGTYRLGGMAPGEYIVSTFAPGFAGEYFDDAYSPDQATIVVVDGLHAVEDIDFELWPMYYLYGERDAGLTAVVVYGAVTESNGAPVEGATVYVLNESEKPVASARAGADGRFEIPGLVPGSYRVYAGKIGATGAYNGNARSFADAAPIAMSGGRVEVNLVVQAGTGTGTDDDDPLPHGIELLGNYPNPFNPETTILFRLGESMHVRLVVYNLLGEEIAVLYEGRLEAGQHAVTWNGRTGGEGQAATGTYVYRLEGGARGETGTMVLLR